MGVVETVDGLRLGRLRDILAEPVETVALAKISFSAAVLLGRPWSTFVLRSGTRFYDRFPAPGTDQGNCLEDLAGVLGISQDDTQRALALASMSVLFQTPEETERYADTVHFNFLHPMKGATDLEKLRETIRNLATDPPPLTGHGRYRLSGTMHEPAASNLFLQLGDTEATADLFLALINKLSPGTETSDTVCVALGDVPKALDLQEVPGGIPETLLLAAAYQAGAELVQLIDGRVGVNLPASAKIGGALPSEAAVSPYLGDATVILPDLSEMITASSPLIHHKRFQNIADGHESEGRPGNWVEETRAYVIDPPFMASEELLEIKGPGSSPVPVKAFASREATGAVTIGKLHFSPETEQLAALLKAGRDLPDSIRDGLGEMACEEELLRRFWLAEEASTSDSHSFAQQRFIPYSSHMPGDGPWQAAQILIDGGARLLRSRVVVIRDSRGDDIIYGDMFEGVDLDAPSKDVSDFLQQRRGQVGLPLVSLWSDLRHLDLLPAEVRKISRNYGSGRIPKFEVDGFLFHIENKTLREQIEQMINTECRGIVWSQSFFGHEGDAHDPFEASPFGEYRTEDAERDTWRRDGHARPYQIIDLLALEFRNPEAALASHYESMRQAFSNIRF